MVSLSGLVRVRPLEMAPILVLGHDPPLLGATKTTDDLVTGSHGLGTMNGARMALT